MSRTDVHRPWRVQALDPFNRHRIRWVPENHLFGTELEFHPLYQICGCPMCTGAPWRKAARRKVRHNKRKIIQKEIELG
jgi:hypothetical protein